MIEQLAALLLGVALGTAAGLLPGVGIFFSLIIVFPVLQHMAPLTLMIFYIAAISATQYTGSITATVLGVPGEASSLPAVSEGHKMFQRGQGAFAISGAAIGSFVGSTIALALTLVLLPVLAKTTIFYSTYFQFVLLVTAAIFLCVTANNRIWLSILLYGLGALLGSIGVHPITRVPILTFDLPDLYGGLPVFPVLVALYVLPEMLKIWNGSGGKPKYRDRARPCKHWQRAFRHRWTIVRASVVGYLTGLVPGLTYVLASNLAYAIERRLSRGDAYASMTASETANNAAAFSCLIPLLILAMPITASETLVYDLLARHGFAMGLRNLDTGFFVAISVALMAANFVCLFISWPMAKYLVAAYNLSFRFVKPFLCVVILFCMSYVGWQENNLKMSFLTLILLAPLGVVLRRCDTLPAMFAFMLQAQLLALTYRFGELIG